MSVGRIKYNKLLEYKKLKKYKQFNIPIKHKNCWYLKYNDFISKKDFIYNSTIQNVFSEYCKFSLIYYFCYGKGEDFIFHVHTFDEVVDKLYEFPESFYIPDKYIKYYSKQEIDFLNILQKKLLNDDLKDIGIFYKEHPLKKEYESAYLEYNIDELKKRKKKTNSKLK